MLRDGRFGERSDRDGRAILRLWWPIRRRLKECWDGRPSAILPMSCRVRGGDGENGTTSCSLVVASDRSAEQLAEKDVPEREAYPRRLKPNSKQCSYRSGEPLRHPKPGATSSFPQPANTLNSAACFRLPDYKIFPSACLID